MLIPVHVVICLGKLKIIRGWGLWLFSRSILQDKALTSAFGQLMLDDEMLRHSDVGMAVVHAQVVCSDGCGSNKRTKMAPW